MLPWGLYSIASGNTFGSGGALLRLATCWNARPSATPRIPDALALLSPHSSARGSLSVSSACSAPVPRCKASPLAHNAKISTQEGLSSICSPSAIRHPSGEFSRTAPAIILSLLDTRHAHKTLRSAQHCAYTAVCPRASEEEQTL